MTERNYKEQMVADRRWLHAHPEDGWNEFETTYFIVKRLEELGLKALAGIEVIEPKAVMGRNEEAAEAAQQRAREHGVPEEFLKRLGGYTGAMAVLETGRPGPVTAIRVDIDCLPIEETTSPEHEANQGHYRSEYPGFSHACGHDGHTAVGLGVAAWLADHKDSLNGTVKVLFQPAEEGVRGARPMSESGIVDDVDYLMGSHVGGAFHSGEVCVCDGGFLASTKFDINFIGLQAHAGNAPNKGHNALVAAACATMMLQGIPRHADGVSRVSVGKLMAGEGRNIIAAHASMEMEVRGETQEVNDFMAENVENIIAGVEKAYQVKAEISKVGESSTLVLCPEMYSKMEEAMHNVPGISVKARYHGPAGSEDCSWLIRKVAEHGGQAGFFIYGCEHKGHHRPDFDIQDERNLPVAFNVYVSFAKLVNRKN